MTSLRTTLFLLLCSCSLAHAATETSASKLEIIPQDIPAPELPYKITSCGQVKDTSVARIITTMHPDLSSTSGLNNISFLLTLTEDQSGIELVRETAKASTEALHADDMQPFNTASSSGAYNITEEEFIKQMFQKMTPEQTASILGIISSPALDPSQNKLSRPFWLHVTTNSAEPAGLTETNKALVELLRTLCWNSGLPLSSEAQPGYMARATNAASTTFAAVSSWWSGEDESGSATGTNSHK